MLAGEIKKGVTRNLYLFYGPEEYLVKHYAREVEKLTVEPPLREICVNVFEDKPDMAAIYDACAAYPMFGAKRLVILKNCGLFKQGAGAGKTGDVGAAGDSGIEKSGESDFDDGATGGSGGRGATSGSGKEKSGVSEFVGGGGATSGSRAGRGGAKKRAGARAPDSDGLIGVIDNLPEFTCLLIIESEIDKRLALFKRIGEKGLAVNFEYRTPIELEDWARAVAGRAGRQFARDALRSFIGNCGASMTEIKSELDKLLMYTADKKGITSGDVADVCCISLKTRIFGLLDFIAANRRRQALSELESMLDDREPAMRILATLSNHILLLCHMKALADSGVKLPQAVGILKINQYRAEKMWRQSARATQENLYRAVELCRSQDMAIKGGRIDDVMALRLLVASISI